MGLECSSRTQWWSPAPGGLLLELCSLLLAWLVGSVLRVRRAHVVSAMARAGIADPERTAHLMYRSLARGLLELVWFGPRRNRSLADVVDLDSQTVRAWLGGATGAVIATAHTANWDLVACAVAARAPLTVVTKRLSLRWLDRIWQSLRAGRGVRLITAGRAARTVLRALGRKELVALLVDQAPERRRGVVRVMFLGELAGVDLAPALLAMRARVPLVCAFPRRRPDGRLEVEVVRVLIPPSHPSRIWAVDAMRAVTAELERFVLAHPEQWLWMHRRWKD